MLFSYLSLFFFSYPRLQINRWRGKFEKIKHTQIIMFCFEECSHLFSSVALTWAHRGHKIREGNSNESVTKNGWCVKSY